MANLFFDFDGTIINSQVRLYNLFCELCPTSTFSYEEYWEIKRNHVTQEEFLTTYCNYSKEQVQKFRLKWFEMVENESRMEEDFLVEGIFDILKKLSATHSLYLVTHRQNEQFVALQLKKFDLHDCFQALLVTKQKIKKSELIKQKVKVKMGDFVIGDTGEDIKTAQEFGLRSVAVTWGVLNENVLETYKPDYLIKSVDGLYKVDGLFS